MASTKDIYEAKVFAANIWAAGAFRGTGVDSAAIHPGDATAVVSGIGNATLAGQGVGNVAVAVSDVGKATVGQSQA